jgi:cytochrome P450
LIEVEERGEHLTTGELLATINLLLVAGHETAANLIGNGVLALLRHPAELDRLRGNPALAGAVVEEALRYDAPVQMATRVTTAPARFAGVEAAPGTRVIILLAAANRDPAVHDEPDRFFPGRENQSHLAFSSGPHFCLGAGLARLEGELAFSRIFDRLINPRLAPDGLEYRPHLNLRGPGKLVVEFDGIRPPRP